MPFHRIEGDGEPLVLLNGVSMTLSGWEELVRRIPAGYRSLRLDFRGQLRSPGEPPPRQSDHGLDVLRLLDALEIPRVHAVGTSFGGAVAMWLAAEHSERVRTLTTVTVGAGENPGLRERVREWLVACRSVLAGGDRHALYDAMEEQVFSDEFLGALGPKRSPMRRQMASLPDAWYAQLVSLLESVDATIVDRAAGRISCPALVIGGGDDRLVRPNRVVELAAKIPGAELEILPGAGHALPLEQPEGLANRLVRFLEQHPLEA